MFFSSFFYNSFVLKFSLVKYLLICEIKNRAFIYKGFLSDEECDHLVNLVGGFIITVSFVILLIWSHRFWLFVFLIVGYVSL